MVEEKASGRHGHAVEGGHGICPLCEVINDDDGIVMLPKNASLHSIKSMAHLQNGPAVMTGWRGAGGACILEENI